MKKGPDWEAINRDWQESGLPQPVYCKKAGVSYAQFCSWRSRQIKLGKFGSLRHKVKSGVIQGSSKAEEIDFIPIDLTHPKPKAQAQNFMELHLPHGVVLRMPINVS